MTETFTVSVTRNKNLRNKNWVNGQIHFYGTVYTLKKMLIIFCPPEAMKITLEINKEQIWFGVSNWAITSQGQ